MAFTGTPVIKLVADGLVRIHVSPVVESVFSLASGASGTIGLFEKTVAADLTLPQAFQPRPYVNGESDNISLQESVQVEITYVETDVTVQPIMVVKTGTTPEDFAITLTNTSNLETDSGDIEIYVRFH